MLPIAELAILAGIPLVGLLVVGFSARWRPWGALLLGILALGGGLLLGVLVPRDLLGLPQLLGLPADVAALLAWGVFGGLAAAAGGVRIPGPPVLAAALAGALMGELGAAAALAVTARDRDGAARLALAAAGGSLLGRIGDPALLILADRVPHLAWWTLLPLALAMVVVAAPRAWHLDPQAGSVGVTVVGLVCAGVALARPALAPVALGLGALVLAGLAFQRHGRALFTQPRPRALLFGPSLWVLGGVLTVLVATAAGLPFLASLGLDELVLPLGAALSPALAVASAGLATLVDGSTAALLVAALEDRSTLFAGTGPATAVLVGTAVGGLGPLVVARALRAGIWRWLLQVALAVMWVWWLTR